MSAPAKQIESVQVLRALAAISVVAFHAQLYARTWAESHQISTPILDRLYSFRDFGSIGVDLFFIISGFIMTQVTWGRFGDARNILPFLKKRFVRLVPTYWFYTLITVALAHLFVAFSPERILDLKKVAFSLFFLPTVDPDGSKSHVLSVAWTLVYEIFFYLCVCICIPFSRRIFLPLIGLLFAGASIGLPILMPLVLHRPFSFMQNASLLLEFIFGIGIAYLYRMRIQVSLMNARLFIALGIAGMLAWIFKPFPIGRSLAWGIPCALVFFGVIFGELQKPLTARWRHLVELGDSSYTLYLVHIPFFHLVLLVLSEVTRVTGGVLPSDLLFVFLTLSSVFISHGLYTRIEKKFLNALSS